MALGVALVVMPVAFDMFDRAPKGATMIVGFRPFMTEGRLESFQRDIAEINAAVKQSDVGVASYLEVPGHGGDGRRTSFDSAYRTFAGFVRQWPGVHSHMASLLNAVQANVGNYSAVSALPSFNLFAWFFVIPGALVLLLLGAVAIRHRAWRSIRWILVVLGLGLIAAPVAFQMFQRAPKGAAMMSAFRAVETTSNVQTIQGYFGTMAVGQGAIRLELVPALERSGLSSRQISARFPAIATLDREWVHILNDMTPMIGAMSDNVANYEAIAALPPFTLFPYFFAVPGVLIAAISILASQRAPIEATSQAKPASHAMPISSQP